LVLSANSSTAHTIARLIEEFTQAFHGIAPDADPNLITPQEWGLQATFASRFTDNCGQAPKRCRDMVKPMLPTPFAQT
jgi:hypothetical protein